MEKICLDSEVALGFLKGERAIVEKLQYYAHREEVCMDAFTAMEIDASVRKREVAEEFLSSINILPFDRKAAQLATQLIRENKKREMRTPLNALIAAAVCITNNAFLFTKQRNMFEGIKGLRLV
ncbi:MAG TPA: type II toxin-antitoxin system VapC family toxin [Candidatus Bilamarchaeaceae archaeon]|nr:type II toxin-antitoxin system VapC family toxin [Candidatus Bilamarchaeaceae archaeon]